VQQAVIGRVTDSDQPPAPLLSLLGWLAIAGTDATVVAIRIRATSLRVGAAVVLHAFGQVLAVAAAVMCASLGWRLLRGMGRWRWLAAAGVGWAFARGVLGEDLSGLRHWVPAWAHLWLITLLLAAAGTLLIWLAVRAAGRLPRRRWVGLVGLVGSGALAVANAGNLPVSYSGLHLLGLIVTGCLAATSVAWAGAGRLRLDVGLQRLLFGAAATGAAMAVLRAPSNAQLILLLREPGAVLAPYLASLRPALPTTQRIPAGQRQWFEDRSALPVIPPSVPPLVQRPLVVMLGIDSFRADLMADPRRRADLPELFRLRSESTYFANARSAGSSTVPSLSAIFSGLYYSQLYWRLKENAGPDVYPDQDTNPRFPELLSRAGVNTVGIDPVGFLLDEFGVVRGFREEQSMKTGPRYALGHVMMDAALARLEHVSAEPMFLFLHLIDAHSPYNRAGPKPTPFEGYVAELGLVDEQLGRLRAALARHDLIDRTVLIVLSDHGEAFGEHGMTWHGTTLYDELLRVPLMIWTHGGHPRTVVDPVSLMDLGPTVLDLMGVATPARFMGQSLVPYLRGERPRLTRPILAEARLQRALVTPEGMKVIYDTRSQTVEIFDLNRDPKEEQNLFGISGDDSLGELRTFFQVHTLRRPGYEVPYRKW
jgi:hypothetical protein